MSKADHRSKAAMKPFAACRISLSWRALWLVACFASVVISLSACSFSGADSGGQAAPPPAPGQAAAAAATPQATPMDTFRALAPPQGLKFTPLFAEEAGDEDARFRRLEQAVQAMKNDFDTVMPSLVRLVAIEKDINNLVTQLQTLTDSAPAVEAEPLSIEEKLNRIPREDINAGGTENAPAATTADAPPAAASSRVTPEAASTGQLPPEGAASPSSTTPPVPLDLKTSQEKPPEKKVEQASPPPANAGPILGDVKAVRIGDHADKTRIVLDMTAKADVKATLENNGKRLVLELPQMSFLPEKNWDALSAALVSGYRYENGKLVLDLLYPSEIKSRDVISPNGTPNHRLVIDLFSKDVHQ